MLIRRFSDGFRSVFAGFSGCAIRDSFGESGVERFRRARQRLISRENRKKPAGDETPNIFPLF
jgi:hypothetical protein